MTEPPRPGEGQPGYPPDPSSPPPSQPPYSVPGEGAAPSAPPPQYQTPSYGTPPPTSGGGVYGTPPPTSGGGYPPPSSGAPYGQQPGGYGQPAGGYPPQGGYGQPGAYGVPGAVPTGYANNDEKTWALVAHFGGAAGAFLSWGSLGWVAPLIAMLSKGNQSPTVRAHSVAALNFHILWAIISVISLILGSCLFWLVVPMILFAVPLIPIIFGIIAGIKANEGQLYRYPMSASFIK